MPLVGWTSLFPLGALQVDGGTGFVDKNLVTKRIFSEASRLRDFEAGSTWDEVGVLGEGHKGLDVGEKVRI